MRVVGVLVLVALAAAALLLHDLDGRVREGLVAAAADGERAIGRAVTIGAVHVAMGSTAEIVVSDVVVAGAAGAAGILAEPLLRVPTIRLGVRLGPLVRSWGRSIAVTRFELEGPEITLVRTPGGLSTDDVRARLAALPPRPPPTSRPAIVLDTLGITAAKLHLRAEGGAPGEGLDVDPITLRGVDVRPDAESRFTLAAVIAPGAALDATLEIAPPVGAAPGSASTLRRVTIHGAGVRVAPILAWLRARAAPSIDLADAELGLDFVVDPGSAAVVRGKATLAHARFAATGADGERTLGAPADLSLALDATIDPEAGTLSARSLEIGVGAASAHGALAVHGLGAAPVIDRLELDGAGDAAAILALLPEGARPRRLAVAGPVVIALRGGDSADEAHGTVKLDLHEVRVVDVDAAGHEERGEPTTLSVGATIAVTRSTGALRVSEAELHVGEIVARGEATAHDLATAPVIDALAISASGPTEHLLGLAPPTRRKPGLALMGPFSATLTAHGTRADLAGKFAVDLDHAGVRAPGFQKPIGARLGLDVEGRVAAVVDVTRASLRVGPLALSARGKVWSAERLDIAFEWREAALGPLLALFPDAAARLAGATVEGKLAGSGTIQRGGGKSEVAARLALSSALLRRGAVALLGAPTITVALMTTADKVSAKIAADLGAATLGVAPIFTKPAGRPATLSFAIKREGDRVSVLDAHLDLPGATIDGLAVEVAPHRAHVAIAAASVSLAPLAQMMPLLGAVIPPKLAAATARFNLDFTGDPEAPAAAKLHVGALSIESGLGRLVGSVDVEGLGPPRAIRFDITDGALDLGGLDGPPESAPDAPSDLAISGHVHLDTVRARGATLHPVDAELGFSRGRLTVTSLHAGAFGGSIDVEKSFVDLASPPEIDLHARFDTVDLARIGASAADELRGRASGKIDLHASGDGRDELTRSLRGQVRLALTDVHARHAFKRKVTVTNPILGEIFARASKKGAGEARVVDLRAASALFDVSGSRLTTNEPVTARSDELKATLRGTIGFDQALALDGQVEIAPAAIAAATDGALVPLRPIPLQLRLVGAPGELQIEVREIAESVRALAGAVRNGLVGGAAAPLP